MVVASGEWVQNASFPASQNNSNLNLNNTQNNKMTAKGILISRDNSHPFEERTLSLEQPVKIGRSVARARATPNNAIFDCKVLSRNHALLWYSAGKFYLQDTRSSNGTFVNNQRLSASGLESTPKEVCSGDIVQFGVDVVESTKKVTHGCIVATLKLYLPDGKEAKASFSTSVNSPTSNVSLEDLYKLNHIMQEASMREKALYSKLILLQQLVESTRKAANQSWKASIAEDRLLSWVEAVESQLAVYSKNYTEDKIRNELVQLHEEKAQYQNTAKGALQKILQEKLEVTQRLVQLEGRLSETEEECQSLHNVVKYTQTELQEISTKYTEAQKKLQETTNKLMESEEKVNEMVQSAEQEKEKFLLRLKQECISQDSLRTKLHNSRLDSVNIYKQITALRNYMQTLYDMNLKVSGTERVDSKDGEDPIEAINAILNKLNSIHADNTEVDALLNSKCKLDSNSMENYPQKNPDRRSRKRLNETMPDIRNLVYICVNGNLVLVNDNANMETSDIITDSDVNSDATDDTCSITSDDTSEKSVIENKKEEFISKVVDETFIPHKMEVRFACEENGEDLDVHYIPMEQHEKELEAVENNAEVIDNCKTINEPTSAIIENCEKKEGEGNRTSELNEDTEGEHLEGDYVKTLKPLSKNDTTQQSLHSKEYVLQSLIGSLDSLKGEDNLESQQIVKKELEDLKEWLIHVSHEVIIDKLKELYYRAKNETQRIQEVNEELVILKEKYNAFVEEKAELSRKYMTLKAQCGDLLNATYTVPLHYVAPIALILVFMLLEKMF